MQRYKLTESELAEKARNYVHYVDEEEKAIGVFATNEDAIKADCYYVKRLKKKYNYHIQMVIK